MKSKNNKSRLSAILVGSMLILTLVLSGCGSTAPTAASSAGNNSSSAPAPAETKVSFAGKTINFIVPFSPGGGFDAQTRLIGPYLEKETGATVVVQNVPGGGSIVGSNKVYESKADGLTIGMLGGSNLVYAKVSGTEGVKFDAGKYTYLAGVSDDPSVLIVTTKKPFNSMDDLKKQELKIAVTGVGEDDFYTWSAIAKAFGIKFKFVTGWEGASQWLAALAAGQVDGGMISASSGLPPIQNGYAKALLQVSPKRDYRYKDIPTALEIIPANDPNRQTIQQLTDIVTPNHLIAASPGLGQAETKVLRDAFDKVMKNQELLDKGEKSQRPFVYQTGTDLEKTLKTALTSVESLKPIFDEAAKSVK